MHDSSIKQIREHIEYVILLEKEVDFYKNQFKEINDCGLADLKADYNLTWEAVYNIVQKAIEKEGNK